MYLQFRTLGVFFRLGLYLDFINGAAQGGGARCAAAEMLDLALSRIGAVAPALPTPISRP